MPEEDFKENWDLLAAILTGGGAIFLFFKNAILKNKKIENESLALDSYESVFKTINKQVEHITAQYNELLEKYEALSRKCEKQAITIKNLEERLNESERENKAFKEQTNEHITKIDGLLSERAELVENNIVLLKENMTLKKQRRIQ